MNSLLKLTSLHRNIIIYTECKRFAGHNKWSNIRHIKMARDSERSNALQMLITKMKVAIADGKSAKPEDNVSLARLIDQAKQKSLPLATIKNFLEKMQKSKIKGHSVLFQARGPSGCVILIQLITDNVTYTKQQINHHLKKSLKFTSTELPSDNFYVQKGIVLTEVDGNDIDKALNDAIEIGAEDAEICKEEDKEFLQFSCQASELVKVRNKLEALNYKIIQADVEYIPQIVVSLSDEDMEAVSKLYDRLKGVPEVVQIHSNIS